MWWIQVHNKQFNVTTIFIAHIYLSSTMMLMTTVSQDVQLHKTAHSKSYYIL